MNQRQIKYVPQIDTDGYFCGMSIADESPVRPGEYEYARGAVDVSPPPRDALLHEAIHWTGNDWSYEPDYTGATPYDTRTGLQISNATIMRGQSLSDLFATLLQPQYGQQWNEQEQCWEWTLSQLKALKLTELAALRWEVQCAGVRAPEATSVVFASTPDDKERLKQTIDDAELVGDSTVTFKAQSGFAELTIDQLRSGYKAIVQHTQLCYKNEYALTGQINALGNAQGVQNFNLLSGWPA